MTTQYSECYKNDTHNKKAMETNRWIALIEVWLLHIFIPTSNQQRHSKWSHTS